ncbi:5' nucleotidase, NT5C type [Fulvivirga sediminis]|uniref:5'(3')-deoxyribonucleotidase n=1 Tax=Fulvivirga sediminis TaxID=2803949 RepID=A0A937K299_9BACT|nr:5'(3')-deoxyribonucleotidase [Fulvivirga sediminis]MBL3658150.1 5'(3')-deoxyribonucleotidase [Fulvivirga sediminis]
MKKSVAIDMDHVLADIEQQMIKWYADQYGVLVAKETLKGKAEQEAFPDKEKLRKLLFMPGFFRDTEVIEGAIDAVKKLIEDFEVYIVSAAMEFPQSLGEKKEWLTEHFPFISWKNIVFCGDKSIIDTDFMIDDHMKNLNYCKGRGMLFTASHNANIEYDVRVNNWKEACDYLYQNR